MKIKKPTAAPVKVGTNASSRCHNFRWGQTPKTGVATFVGVRPRKTGVTTFVGVRPRAQTPCSARSRQSEVQDHAALPEDEPEVDTGQDLADLG